MRRLGSLPLLVTLAGVAALAMLLPTLHAMVLRDYAVARAFGYSCVVVLMLVALIGIATTPWRPRDPPRGLLAAMVMAYVVLPPVLALPFHQALPEGASFHGAWFEMVSAFTTTGATLYEPQALGPTLHLWRALVGWMGGLFVLVAAIAILAPLNLGGFEVVTGGAVGRGAAAGRGAGQGGGWAAERVLRYGVAIFPVYGGLTLLLWLFLLLAGDPSLVALCHAMGTLSSSGISAVGGLGQTGSGLVGEMLIFLFFVFAISRRAYVGTVLATARSPVRRDPEILVAAGFLVVLPVVQFLQHWTGLSHEGSATPAAGLMAFWGAIFTTLSFLTTTGYASLHWDLSRDWAGPGSSGLILLGLALIGGGVATTAGGVKLLRVYALFRHGERGLESLIHPHSVGGDGLMARRIRNQGALVAWVFFVLFAVSVFVVMAALTLAGLGFEPAMVFAVAALSTTGPLVLVAGETQLAYADLGRVAHSILALAMVLGRLETLALLVLLLPDTWRR